MMCIELFTHKEKCGSLDVTFMSLCGKNVVFKVCMLLPNTKLKNLMDYGQNKRQYMLYQDGPVYEFFHLFSFFYCLTDLFNFLHN